MRVKLIDRGGTPLVRNIPPISILGQTVDRTLIDLYSIANGIFLSEDVMKSHLDVASIEFECYGSYSNQLSEQISLLIEFMFGRTVAVSFTPNQQTFLFNKAPQEFANGYTCLFSAGLDSYVGFLEARRKFGSVKASFIKHKDQGALSTLADRLGGGMGSRNLKTIEAPEHESYTRLSRGVLYVLNSFLLRERNVIISEVGPTMHQPRFTLLDDISITTHPAILRFSKRIAEEVLGTKLTIIKPNENLTKAELASVGSSYASLGRTCSCRNTMFAAAPTPNCGTCYACVVRRLALFVVGTEGNVYRYDWSTDEKNIDNAVQLVRFSFDYVANKESMPWYTLDSIKRNRKEDLFHRFSLDNLAGLLLMKEQGETIAPALERLLALALESISRETLKERISTVRHRNLEPDYRNVI